MIDTGRVCMKLVGREAGKYCVILKKIDDNYVMIDGDVRKRKCNLKHLELIDVVLNVKATATKADILKLLKSTGFVKEIKKEKTKKEKKPKPVKKRVLKFKKKQEEKQKMKEAKK